MHHSQPISAELAISARHRNVLSATVHDFSTERSNRALASSTPRWWASTAAGWITLPNRRREYQATPRPTRPRLSMSIGMRAIVRLLSHFGLGDDAAPPPVTAPNVTPLTYAPLIW